MTPKRKNRLRRSMLFVPGANAAMLSNAFIYPADALMFDLEDAVAVREKDAARHRSTTPYSTRFIAMSKPSFALMPWTRSGVLMTGSRRARRGRYRPSTKNRYRR